MKQFTSRGALALIAAFAIVFGALPVNAQQNKPSNLSFVGGRFVARNYNYPGVQIAPGTNIPSGAGTITLYAGSVRLSDGRTIVPFSAGGFNTTGQAAALPAIPITVGAGTTKETVTPTAVSGCFIGAPQNSCKITATFANAHGQGELVTSGSSGIQEAINDAGSFGGGAVVVDSGLAFAFGGNGTITSAILAANVVSGVSIEDTRGGLPTYYTAQGGASFLAAPTTLTATTVGFGLNGANTTAGTYTGASTYHVCIAYVDVAGQEGPCSADFSGLTAGTGTTNQIGIAAPAASTGAVGYTVYISLASGTYNLTYQAPLTSSVCTLTTVEAVTPACAVTNSAYGQTGSNAIISALTVNTAPLHLLATTASTTSAYIGTPNGRTTYVYTPHSNVGTASVPASNLAFTIAPAAATTVPAVIGTVNLPPGLMNVLGRTLRVCGQANMASTGSTATISRIQLLWDGAGSDTAGAPVIVGNLSVTATDAASAQVTYSFCEDLQTTVSGAGVTAGSIFPGIGQLVVTTGTASTVLGTGNDPTNAAVASLNLAGTGGNTTRLHVVYLHTTGTDAAGVTLTNLTVEAI